MSISYVKGDATQPLTQTRVIPHIVNDIGAWGAGFVVALSKRFGEGPKEAYQQWHNGQVTGRHSSSFRLGQIQYIKVADDMYVCNMVAQHGTGPDEDGNPPIRYGALEGCLRKLAEDCVLMNPTASVHAPRFGSGLAGGSWPLIEGLIYKTLIYKGVPVTVYDL